MPDHATTIRNHLIERVISRCRSLLHDDITHRVWRRATSRVWAQVMTRAHSPVVKAIRDA